MLHDAYLDHLRELITTGDAVNPREQGTLEHLNAEIPLADSRCNLLDVPRRNLNFRYAVAEWLWIQFGRNDVASIAQYNSKLTFFSDDGMFFRGAYGPHIQGGWKRCVGKLKRDPNTRQAVLQIPRPLEETKDEPCTLSLQFIARRGHLHCVATMRSNDAWLGLPYDVFTFTQIQNVMAGELGLLRGWFTLNIGSAHLYTRDIPKAMAVLSDPDPSVMLTPDLPGLPPAWLEDVLVAKSLDPIPAGTGPAGNVWLRFAQVLTAPTIAEAREALLA